MRSFGYIVLSVASVLAGCGDDATTAVDASSVDATARTDAATPDASILPVDGGSSLADGSIGDAAASADASFDAGPPCASEIIDDLLAGTFRWTSTAALVAPPSPYIAVKDPSIVRYGGQYHLFTTLRAPGVPPDIGYLSFADWPDAAGATWQILELTPNYEGAPDVFYFTPQHRWYMVLQLGDMSRGIPYGPAFTTTDDVTDPTSWSAPTPLGIGRTPTDKVGLDFWVIADTARVYLFFTTDDGDMWRTSTRLADFPSGWGPVELALHSTLFEATHTYALRGLGRYLTVAEAQGGTGHRYYQAYVADRLDGAWTPLASTLSQPFAGPTNVTPAGGHWTDAYSHGEMLRAGYDESLEVDPTDLHFVFQGVLASDWTSSYGDIPWRLGRLDPVPPTCP